MADELMDMGQQRWVEQEFIAQAPQNDIDVEAVETHEEYVLVRMLVPWNFVVLEYLQQVVLQCTFLREDFFITNCEKPSMEEILNWKAQKDTDETLD